MNDLCVGWIERVEYFKLWKISFEITLQAKLFLSFFWKKDLVPMPLILRLWKLHSKSLALSRNRMLRNFLYVNEIRERKLKIPPSNLFHSLTLQRLASPNFEPLPEELAAQRTTSEVKFVWRCLECNLEIPNSGELFLWWLGIGYYLPLSIFQDIRIVWIINVFAILNNRANFYFRALQLNYWLNSSYSTFFVSQFCLTTTLNFVYCS